MESIALLISNSGEKLLKNFSSVILLSLYDKRTTYYALVLLYYLVHVFLHILVNLSVTVHKMLFCVHVIYLDLFLFGTKHCVVPSGESLA